MERWGRSAFDTIQGIENRNFGRNDLFPFLTLSKFHPQKTPTDATTEKALPSPATALGRVDGRRSLDSVLSTTSVFGGGAAATGISNTSGSVASSPLSAGVLSSRASLDSARGSADVRTLLWRASIPGECLIFRFLSAEWDKRERKRAHIAHRRRERGADLAQESKKLSRDPAEHEL